MEESALVIGEGIVGIQFSIELTELGFNVYLVERETSIGGRMAQLDKTFPIRLSNIKRKNNKYLLFSKLSV